MRQVAFGTDGIRGTAGRWPCTPEVALRVGRAAARLAQERGGGRVLVGRDTRPSGPVLEAAVAAGVAGQGTDALMAGVLPTSGVAAALHEGVGDVGVVLTASHNPACDNGFKVLGPRGGKLDDDAQRRLEAWIAEEPADGSTMGSIADAGEAARTAWRRLVRAAAPDPDLLRGRRIALDLAHGALSAHADWLTSTFPADWVLVGSGDGLVNDGVGSEHLESLQRAVRENGCEGGLAFDGDADRCRVVDERGAIVPGDAVAWFLARARRVRTLAVTVMSNGALEASLEGVRVLRTPVGDRHLREAIDTEGAELGCEESGHVLFDDFPAGDGLVTGLRLLGAALPDGTLSDAFAGFTPLPRRLDKVRIARRPPLETVAELEEARIRGELLLGPHGRVFLRYSGTEDLLRVLVEGPDARVVEAVADELGRVAARVLV